MLNLIDDVEITDELIQSWVRYNQSLYNNITYATHMDKIVNNSLNFAFMMSYYPQFQQQRSNAFILNKPVKMIGGFKVIDQHLYIFIDKNGYLFYTEDDYFKSKYRMCFGLKGIVYVPTFYTLDFFLLALDTMFMFNDKKIQDTFRNIKISNIRNVREIINLGQGT